jgi:hypothetical protein
VLRLTVRGRERRGESKRHRLAHAVTPARQPGLPPLVPPAAVTAQHTTCRGTAKQQELQSYGNACRSPNA